MLITMLFTVGNLDDAINAASPFQNAFTNTGSQGLNTFLTLFLFLLILSGNITAVTTVSRETWAFARDGGLPFSRWMSKVSPSVGSSSQHFTPYLPTTGFKALQLSAECRLCHHLSLACPLPRQSWQQCGFQHHHLPQSRGIPSHLPPLHWVCPLETTPARAASACKIQPRPVGCANQHLCRSLLNTGHRPELLPCFVACGCSRCKLGAGDHGSGTGDRPCLLSAAGAQDLRRTSGVRGRKKEGKCWVAKR